MSHPPTTVHVLGQPFRIRTAPGADLDPRVGQTGVAGQLITLADSLAPDQARDTLLHELMHAVLRMMGLPLSDALEERVVGTMSPILLDMLRRNPRLVAYLLE